MKRYLIVVIACVLLIAYYNKFAQASKVLGTGPRAEIVLKMENQTSGEDITGYWKLTLEARDDNGNKILDETERKKGFKNHYSFRFNADGSCQIVESYKGRYEVKTEGGNKMLYVYRKRLEGVEKQDPPPDIYRIISTTKNELVLLEDLGNLVFWVFERAS
jgi:hypothetical protein